MSVGGAFFRYVHRLIRLRSTGDRQKSEKWRCSTNL